MGRAIKNRIGKKRERAVMEEGRRRGRRECTSETVRESERMREKRLGWRERERERGREAVSNSVWSPDPLYGADNGVLPRVWRQG